ncbi:hypothetical protein HU830_03060 [Lactobacillus sp. DCY120]|uniref:site-specific DNA-methyltransferase (cytosine-N(4)-specific) n=1 Tax=Bombilactobacillus apium TaxID=2675299 RepID=A0A850R5N4_9LACO|nr:DNA methyltransferase [Bombilactobacillus apium]NVY96157.1 hypothetical protein [Bombilactobacillus apium]
MNEITSVDNVYKDILNTSLKKSHYFDFKDSNTKNLSHGYHSYPATMIPQLPKLFIETVSKYQNINTIFDPFMGSGTTLVESEAHNIDSTGVDLNPLSVLMTKVKTTYINEGKLEKYYKNLQSEIEEKYLEMNMGNLSITIPTFKNIDFWFKESVIIRLQIIKNSIYNIDDDKIRDFFWVSFSETVRFSSNSRNSEFKLYRMSEKSLDKWNPDVISKFYYFSDRNISHNKELKQFKARAVPILGSSMNLYMLKNNSMDLLITSPPYGDSRTTVAYGQFSRLSLQWLDLKDYDNNNISKIDSNLLGGKTSKSYSVPLFKSSALNNVLKEINAIDNKRCKEVSQFYSDLQITLKEISRVMKPNTYQFWVTANRTVKEIKIPTDIIISELFDTIGIKQVGSFERNIPNKRMPSKNSPTNKTGKTVSTMKKENIVIYKKL